MQWRTNARRILVFLTTLTAAALAAGAGDGWH